MRVAISTPAYGVAPYWGFNPRMGIDKGVVPAIPNMGPLPAHGPTNKISPLAKTHFLLKISAKHSIDLCLLQKWGVKLELKVFRKIKPSEF